MAEKPTTKEEPQKTPVPAAAPTPEGKKPKKKKLRPTNCAQSNKRIRRKDWYYRDGKYFANKQCFKAYVVQQQAQADKKAEEAAAAQAAAPRPTEGGQAAEETKAG